MRRCVAAFTGVNRRHSRSATILLRINSFVERRRLPHRSGRDHCSAPPPPRLAEPAASGRGPDAGAPEGTIIESADVPGYRSTSSVPACAATSSRPSWRAPQSRSASISSLLEFRTSTSKSSPLSAASLVPTTRRGSSSSSRRSATTAIRLEHQRALRRRGSGAVGDSRRADRPPPSRPASSAGVGRRLDNEEADDLTEDLREELPGHTVSRRIERGSAPGQIRVVFDAEAPWIPFLPTRSKFIYHTDLGWERAPDIPMGSTSGRVTVGVAMDNKDDLLETYSGFRFGSKA